jgi:hypothetical protein
LSAVQRAYTVIAALTVVEALNALPLPFRAVYQPPNLYPLLVAEGIFEESTEAPLVTVRVCVAGLPPSALKVTV